jgi:ubiquinone/menaquinone biosynthesis C-methylase UbiE
MSAPTKTVYMGKLAALQKAMKATPNTPFSVYAKVTALTAMNMRYETVSFDADLGAHPFELTAAIVDDAAAMYAQLMQSQFIEDGAVTLAGFKSEEVVEKHQELWQEVWSRHDDEELQALVDLRGHRLDANDLRPAFDGKDCVDFGCGNGSFAFALLERGARSVIGIDFGDKQVARAQAAAEAREVGDQASFAVGDVLNTGFEDSQFGFALVNAVFHHLADKAAMERALIEVARVLEPGGGMWYYIDGEGAISIDLWDMSVDVMAGVDVRVIEAILHLLNPTRGKMVHLMDSFTATYIHSTWNETVAMLERSGFGNFRRLSGADATSWDLDRIEADPYGAEKFGGGEVRVYCERIAG